jgi:anti-sigma factor RsiW
MSCQQGDWDQGVRKKMSLALDGMLPSKEERELRAHLAHCPDCRVDWEGLKAVSCFLAQAPLVSPKVDLALRVEERLRMQTVRWRWVLGLTVSWVWLAVGVVCLVGIGSAIGWLLLWKPILASVGVQVLVQFLLVCLTTMRALWLLASGVPASWLSLGANGCLISCLVIVCLWAWMAFGRQQWRASAV